MGESVLETPRLVLRKVALADAAFVLELVNEPGWLRFIGDKNVRNLDDARDYIRQGPMTSYEQHGFGLYLVGLKEQQTPVGLCGLLRRDKLPDADIGFALLQRYWGRGYAQEAAAAMLGHGRSSLGLARILAITNIGNDSSAKLLERIGMRFEGMIRMSEAEPALRLFTTV